VRFARVFSQPGGDGSIQGFLVFDDGVSAPFLLSVLYEVGERVRVLPDDSHLVIGNNLQAMAGDEYMLDFPIIGTGPGQQAERDVPLLFIPPFEQLMEAGMVIFQNLFALS